MQTEQTTTPRADVPTRRARRIRSVLRSSLVRYLVVGGLSFAVDAGVLFGVLRGTDAPRVVAVTAGFWTALLFNFTLNRAWAFGGHESVPASFARYISLVAFNFVATIAVVELGTAAGAPLLVVKALATGLTVLWNFVAYRFWVFR